MGARAQCGIFLSYSFQCKLEHLLDHMHLVLLLLSVPLSFRVLGFMFCAPCMLSVSTDWKECCTVFSASSSSLENASMRNPSMLIGLRGIYPWEKSRLRALFKGRLPQSPITTCLSADIFPGTIWNLPNRFTLKCQSIHSEGCILYLTFAFLPFYFFRCWGIPCLLRRSG